MKQPGSAADPLWYKDAIIYELHVKAFMDGNNDGIGDFQGLLTKLDYLQDLGVTCIWLLPFFPSPLRDDGYDIADYLSVHPNYGTMEDFREFLVQAHNRGLQVMIELVSITPPTNIPGSSGLALPQKTRLSATSTCGVIPIKNIPARASFLRIPRNPIGPGILMPNSTTGIVSFRINRT